MNKWDKFKAHWEEIGKPSIEFRSKIYTNWTLIFAVTFEFLDDAEYRIAGDRHWLLRKKWVDSGKTLPIEYEYKTGAWDMCVGTPAFDQGTEYREAVVKPEIVELESKHIEKPYVDHLGDSFIALGNALKDRNTNITDLTELANQCGLDLRFRIVAK